MSTKLQRKSIPISAAVADALSGLAAVGPVEDCKCGPLGSHGVNRRRVTPDGRSPDSPNGATV